MNACKHCGADLMRVVSSGEGTSHYEHHECRDATIEKLKGHLLNGTLPSWEWTGPLVEEHRISLVHTTVFGPGNPVCVGWIA